MRRLRLLFIVIVLSCGLSGIVACERMINQEISNRSEEVETEIISSQMALEAYAAMLFDLSQILSKSSESQEIEAEINAYFSRRSKEIESYYASIEKYYKTLNEEDLMKSHQSFIQREEVKSFLDALDDFRERFADESAERVDMRLSELYILSE